MSVFVDCKRRWSWFPATYSDVSEYTTFYFVFIEKGLLHSVKKKKMQTLDTVKPCSKNSEGRKSGMSILSCTFKWRSWLSTESQMEKKKSCKYKNWYINSKIYINILMHVHQHILTLCQCTCLN